MAKASFSAYLLGKILLKTGEKVHFSTQKSTTNFGRPFFSVPCPFLASKSLKYAVFAFQKAKKVRRKRGLRHKHKLFGPNFLRTFLTLTPGWPGVKKLFPTDGVASKRAFGADVHDFGRGRP